MGRRENKVEKYLDQEVQKIGGITRKWVSPGREGVPDRIVIIAGVVLFAEVKTVDGVVSPQQQREFERLCQAGANVYTLYGEEAVDVFIEEVREIAVRYGVSDTDYIVYH
jgi:hypothetical protein